MKTHFNILIEYIYDPYDYPVYNLPYKKKTEKETQILYSGLVTGQPDTT